MSHISDWPTLWLRGVAVTFVLSVLAASQVIPARGDEPFVANDLVVHEWGVFRVHNDVEMANYDLREEWDSLPEFVYGQIKGLNVPTHYGPVEIRRRPILFFHSPQPVELQMRIEFPGGMPGVWWPATFSPSREGLVQVERAAALEWRLGVKAPPRNRAPKLAAPPEVPKDHWIERLREVKSDEVFAMYSENPLDVDREKFVYYDGIFPQGKWLKIDVRKESVALTSQVRHELLDVTVIDRTLDGKVRVGHIPKLAAGEVVSSVTFQEQPAKEFATTAAEKLQKQLVDSGLFADESQALVDLWKKELFEMPGLHVFYRLPPEEYEKRLPLTISPKPKSLVRVGLVVHCHLEPDLEQRIHSIIKQLDAEEFATREAAQRQLAALGTAAYIPLTRLQKTDLAPEVRFRIEKVLEKLDAQRAFPPKSTLKDKSDSDQ